MQSPRIGQAVILVSVVSFFASCTATKDYSSRLFSPRIPVVKDSQALVLKFLEIDSMEKNNENWVSTDFIMGRDTLNTVELDKLALVLPPNPTYASKTKDSSGMAPKAVTGVLATKPASTESEPVAKYMKPGETRTKRSRE